MPALTSRLAELPLIRRLVGLRTRTSDLEFVALRHENRLNLLEARVAAIEQTITPDDEP